MLEDSSRPQLLRWVLEKPVGRGARVGCTYFVVLPLETGRSQGYHQEIVSRHDIYFYLPRTALRVSLKEAIAARLILGLAIPPLRPA